MPRRLKVIEPGLYTTVQDAGRPGWLRYGLPPGGAMDRDAFNAANALLGNDPRAAVLEATGTMPVLESSHACRMAVAYADGCDTLEVGAGERTRFGPIRNGYRAYVAVEGGIDVPVVMGSRSTYVQGGLGGLEGRVLRAGDRLPVGERHSSAAAEQAPCPERFGRDAVRVIPGPEAEWFDCGGLNTFLTGTFSVSARSDRTGLRLDGTPLTFHSEAQMVSAGLAFGTIQVPPSGLPIIMMADHPSTGGYPRIATVVDGDLPLLAQLRPGSTVRFIEWRH